MNEKIKTLGTVLNIIGNTQRESLDRHNELYTEEISGLVRDADDIFQDDLPQLLEEIYNRICHRESDNYHPVSVEFILSYLDDPENRDIMIEKYFTYYDQASIEKLFSQVFKKINQYLKIWNQLGIAA